MNQIIIRDVIIAILLSLITALVLKSVCLVYCMPLPYLLCVIQVEECADRVMRCIHIKRFVKKLRNRKVLRRPKQTGLIKKYYTVIIARRKRFINEQLYRK